MEKQTVYTLIAIAVIVLIILWFGYRALRRYSCCGTCGCDLMTKKERKAFEARKGNSTQSAQGKPQG